MGTNFIITNSALTTGTELTMLVISILALILNSLVIYIILFRIRRKQVDFIFMGFVALVDILIAIAVISTQISKWITFHQVLANVWFCQFSGMIYILLTLTSIDGIGLLSLIRVLAIVKNITIKSKYWYFTMGLILFCNTFLSVLGIFYQIMRVMPSQAYCQTSYRKNLVSKIVSIIMISQFFLMFVIILVSYICITVKHYRVIEDLNKPSNWSSDCLFEERPSLTLYKGIFSRLLALILMYSVCFIPELITMIYNISTRTDRLPIPDAISVSGINLIIIVNSIFVLFYHEEVRKVLGEVFQNCLYYFKNSKDYYGEHDLSKDTQ
jgi:hypothetical protein